MRREQYYGVHYWFYQLPGARVSTDTMIYLEHAGFGYKEDEATVRFKLREKLGLKRLPHGTRVWPKAGM